MSTTPTPPDPLKPREPHARQNAHNALHYPRMADLWRGGMTHPEIATELNNQGIRNSIGETWDGRTVGEVLRRHMDPVEYKALAREGMSRGTRTFAARALARDLAAIPRIVELIRDGLTYGGVAERLRDEGYAKGGEGPWDAGYVGYLLRKHFTPGQVAALRPGGASRALSPRRREEEDIQAALVTRLIAMWLSPMSLKRMMAQLDAEGVKNSRGKRWNTRHLADLLKRHMEPAAYRARAEACPRPGGGPRPARRRHDDVVGPRMIELRLLGLTLEEVADRMNEEAAGDRARLNSDGKPWTKAQISRVLGRLPGGDPLGHSPAHGDAHDAARLKRELAAAKARGGAKPEPARWVIPGLLELGDSHLIPPIVMGEEDPLPLSEVEYKLYRHLIQQHPRPCPYGDLSKAAEGYSRGIIEQVKEFHPRLGRITRSCGRGGKGIYLDWPDDERPPADG